MPKNKEIKKENEKEQSNKKIKISVNANTAQSTFFNQANINTVQQINNNNIINEEAFKKLLRLGLENAMIYDIYKDENEEQNLKSCGIIVFRFSSKEITELFYSGFVYHIGNGSPPLGIYVDFRQNTLSLVTDDTMYIHFAGDQERILPSHKKFTAINDIADNEQVISSSQWDKISWFEYDHEMYFHTVINIALSYLGMPLIKEFDDFLDEVASLKPNEIDDWQKQYYPQLVSPEEKIKSLESEIALLRQELEQIKNLIQQNSNTPSLKNI